MSRFFNPFTQVISNDASDVGGGWKLYFYLTGTSTPKDTFSDSALTTANANPVVADSAGRFGEIFLEAGSYKVVLTDENSVQIASKDPVEGASSTGGVVDEKTAAYTVTVGDSDKLIAVDATSGAITITLPAAATAGDGFTVSVKKTDSSANAVTVDGNGSETIDGAATATLSNRYSSVRVRSDGTNWQILSRGYSTEIANVFKKTQTWPKGADVASASALTLGTDGNYFDITGTTTITSIGTLGVGTVIKLHFDGALTLTHHATDLILPGGANITTVAGDEAEFIEYASGDWRCTSFTPRAAGLSSQAQAQAGTDNATYMTPLRVKQSIAALSGVIGTMQATTSGTAIDFTGIPSGVKRITVMFAGVSISGTDNMLLQIGDSGGIETTGYASVSSTDAALFASTSGFAILNAVAANVYSGALTLTLMDASTFLWVISGTVGDTGANRATFNGGHKALSAELDRLRLTVTGANTFDAGNLNIMYEI